MNICSKWVAWAPPLLSVYICNLAEVANVFSIPSELFQQDASSPRLLGPWSCPPPLLGVHREENCNGLKASSGGSEGPAGITYGRKHARTQPRAKRVRSSTGDLLPEWELRSSRRGGNLYPKALLGASLPLKGSAILADSEPKYVCRGLRASPGAL